MLYHAVRNLAKGGPLGGCRVMGSADFRRAFRLTLMLLLRAAQDVLSVAIVQGKTPNAATFALMRDKAFGWLLAQFSLARFPPLAEVLAELGERVHGLPRLPLPAWALSASPGLMALALHVGAHLHFANPADKAIAACDKTRVPLDTERARIAAVFFGMVRDMSWEGLLGIEVAAFLGSSAPACPAPAATAAAGDAE